MSRDFAPFELYLADKQQNQQLRNLTISYNIPNGESFVLFSPDDDLSKELPELSFLFERTKSLVSMYNRESAVFGFIKEADAIVRELENELNRCIEQGSVAVNRFLSYSVSDLDGAEPEQVLHSWFTGNLDAHFYYHEVNDDLLFEYLCKHCDEIARSTKEEQHTRKPREHKIERE